MRKGLKPINLMMAFGLEDGYQGPGFIKESTDEGVFGK